MAVLRVLSGNQPGQLIELNGDRMILGRHPNCAIMLDNAAVSRHHAQILRSDREFFLEDLRSRNGTHLNGHRIEGRTVLRDGDQVRVCDVVFSFHLNAPPHGPIPPLLLPDSVAGTSPGQAPRPRSEDSAFRGTAMSLSHPPSSSAAGPAAAPPRSPLLEVPDERSSVISTLSVGPLNPLRLTVKPEAKLRAIVEITQCLGRSLDHAELVARLLEGLLRIFPQAERAFAMLLNEETGEYELAGIRTRDENPAARAALISRTIVQQALASKQAILSGDVVEDDRFSASESIVDLKIRSIMCAPLVSPSEDAPLGLIQLDLQDSRYRFNQDDLDLLASVASQAALALDNARLHASLIRRTELERELEFATQVQLGFLPTRRPELPGYEFHDHYEAALSVGGDFFDYVSLPHGLQAVVLGDVAGKGVAAALLMARMHSAIRYQLLLEADPAKAVTALNATVASSGLGFRFVTFVLLVIDPHRHTAALVNAGHLPPLLRSGTGDVQKLGLNISGLPLGVMPDTQYRSVTVPIAPHDLILLYTDGVTEAMNPQNELFGLQRVIELLRHSQGRVDEIDEKLLDEVEKFAGGRDQSDDICLVAVQRTSAAG